MNEQDFDFHELGGALPQLARKELGHSHLSRLPLSSHCARRLCGFEQKSGQWVAEPVVPFRPHALLLWDVPNDALVRYAVQALHTQLKVSSAPVPARFFFTGHSFEEVVRRFEREGIEAPYWCDFDTLYPGTTFALEVTAASGEPLEHLQAVLLGLASL